MENVRYYGRVKNKNAFNIAIMLPYCDIPGGYLEHLKPNGSRMYGVDKEGFKKLILNYNATPKIEKSKHDGATLYIADFEL